MKKALVFILLLFIISASANEGVVYESRGELNKIEYSKHEKEYKRIWDSIKSARRKLKVDGDSFKMVDSKKYVDMSVKLNTDTVSINDIFLLTVVFKNISENSIYIYPKGTLSLSEKN